MTSKEKILQAVKAAQPEATALPPAIDQPIIYDDPAAKFMETATTGGSAALEATDRKAVREHIVDVYLPELRKKWQLENTLRIVSTLAEMEGLAEQLLPSEPLDPHSYQNVAVAILYADFGVAENSALWVPEQTIRVLPFICQHLILLVNRNDILSNMHQAYARMGLGDDPFGAFIAGPSKTADIEQSLVLGAHGPRSLGVYLVMD
ncbi:LUD domain-containing protein [Olivibacter ginsenosidimutans]|uniref:LUD domain-containing protein n=1 Tax=Olivibacter ginsenosidimutans TaxID=1176537 RepID=A0ABP9BYE9_9SPHI